MNSYITLKHHEKIVGAAFAIGFFLGLAAAWFVR